MATRTSLNALTASLNAMSTRLQSGVVRIYTGSQPATPQTAASGTQLAELTLNASAGSVATYNTDNARYTAAAITADTDADNTGTAGWFRVFRTGGFTSAYVEFDGAVGSEMTLNSNDIVQHGTVSITAMTYTLSM